jgi:hypothetical protein
MNGSCSTKGERRNACRILIRKPEKIRLLGRIWRRWENTINMVFREIGFGGMDWIDMD